MSYTYLFKVNNDPSSDPRNDLTIAVPPFQYMHESGVTDSIKATRVANKRLSSETQRPGFWSMTDSPTTFKWVKNYGR